VEGWDQSRHILNAEMVESRICTGRAGDCLRSVLSIRMLMRNNKSGKVIGNS